MTPLRFAKHAEEKLAVVQQLRFTIGTSIVEEIVRHPQKLEAGHTGRVIAQGLLDETHVLRVVYEEGVTKL